MPLIDFTNRERAWAEDQLKNVLGLEVEVHEEANDTVEAGLVIRQNPTATTQVPAGSTVELISLEDGWYAMNCDGVLGT